MKHLNEREDNGCLRACQGRVEPLVWIDMEQNKQQFMIDIDRVLDTLREGLAMHAGNVELVDADPASGKVSVRLQGTCVGCPMSDMTLKAGIEETLVQMVPGVTEVVNVP